MGSLVGKRCASRRVIPIYLPARTRRHKSMNLNKLWNWDSEARARPGEPPFTLVYSGRQGH